MVASRTWEIRLSDNALDGSAVPPVICHQLVDDGDVTIRHNDCGVSLNDCIALVREIISCCVSFFFHVLILLDPGSREAHHHVQRHGLLEPNSRKHQATPHCCHWQRRSVHGHQEGGEFTSGNSMNMHTHTVPPDFVCNMWQANGVKLLGAFDGNPAGHGIAMLYKFGAETGICQNELTAGSLKVVGLFLSDLLW
jgi:hypothetical protein